MTLLGRCFRCGCELVAVAVRDTRTGKYYCAECAELIDSASDDERGEG